MSGWQIAAFTHRGRVRSSNEDAVAVAGQVMTGDMTKPIRHDITGRDCLLMIADGMGGHAQGALASKTALDHLIADADRLSSPESCSNAIEAANERLFAVMSERLESAGMGTTLVGVVLTERALLAFNVGDSRCYRFSGGGLLQLSHDDVASTATDSSGHRQSHAITQCLGGSPFYMPIGPHVRIDAPLAPDEAILLCSDGLSDMVQDRTIAMTLANATDVTKIVRALAASAMQAGAADNLSIVVGRTANSFPSLTAPEI